MDHMTFTTILSLLTTVAMVLLIMWGMDTVDGQSQGSLQSLKKVLVEQARLTTQEREAAQQPFNLSARGKKRVRRIRHKIPSVEGGPQ